MDAPRWHRVKGVFQGALDLPAEERPGYLAASCGDDLELRREVERLLALHSDAGDFLEMPPLARAVGEAATEAETPATIGAYRVLREIGRGGMGTVYLAEQETESFRRQVALKVVQPSLASGHFVRRFQAERQILASLEHPGIARLYDAGTAEGGLPFLVMEHVDGEDLLTYCDARTLGVTERLQLFVRVCAAVQYAHQHLVVHRDLKPSNILVTAEGEPKLLDFGIAKLLQPQLAGGAPAETVAGVRLMTPSYASPEQVRGLPVTTATDVYSLGVVLYQLLAGRMPYRLPTGARHEVERAVIEEEPERPSAVAGRGDSAPAGAARGVSPRRLSALLRGDLDRIVAKALAKEPERRYATAAELAEDVRRHLAGFPVRARPDRLGYRARKFLARHRVAVAAAAVAALSLLAGAAVALWQAAEARRAELAARNAEVAARADAETAERVSEFLVELFAISDPGEARGNAVTARELLDRGAARIEEQLAGQPAVRARLLRVIGRAYGELGLYETEVKALEQALAAQAGLHGPQSPEAAAVLTMLAKAQMDRGSYAEGRDLAARALAIQERALGPEHLELADTLSQLGIAHWYLGDLVRARQVLERSLAMRERLLGPAHGDLGGILNNVAILRAQEGDTEGARRLYERALEIFQRDLGEDHPNVARTLNNLAIVYHEGAGDLARARALHERALAARRKLLAPDHPEIAESLNNLGHVLLDMGELAAAREALAAALEIREKALGSEHHHVATTQLNLGMTLTALGETAAARPLLERALAAFERAPGADQYPVALALAALAELEHRAGDAAAAERHFERALAVVAGSRGADHAETARMRARYAALLRDQGRGAEAAALERPAAATARR